MLNFTTLMASACLLAGLVLIGLALAGEGP